MLNDQCIQIEFNSAGRFALMIQIMEHNEAGKLKRKNGRKQIKMRFPISAFQVEFLIGNQSIISQNNRVNHRLFVIERIALIHSNLFPSSC